jgi:hypothetical protein
MIAVNILFDKRDEQITNQEEFRGKKVIEK